MKTVGIVTDRRIFDDMAVHQANDEYVVAVRDGAGALPLLIPSTDVPLGVADILAAVDGLLFTGSPSNVAPARYGASGPADMMLDPPRDAIALPLIGAAIAAGKPLLAICRGFQELNVALGGTLHQRVHDIPGRLDHRAKPDAPLDVQYGPAHAVTVYPGTLLARLAGAGGHTVNSLHHQGIDRLAASLAVNAVAPDSQIEAVSMPDAPGFVLGVQWHPEWKWAADALSRAIFGGFGAALSSL